MHNAKLVSFWKCTWVIACALPLAGCLIGGSDRAPPVLPAEFLNLGVLQGYTSGPSSWE